MADFTIEMGTPILWANATNFSTTLSGITRTDAITLESLADGAARQGDKVDLGANRAGGYAVKVSVDMAVAPTAGEPIEVYWSSSYSDTAGTGNDGGAAITGADAAWAPSTVATWKRQLLFIGILPLAASTDPQVKTINSYFSPPTRYGSIVVVNNGGQALVATSEGADTMYVALIPITDDAA